MPDNNPTGSNAYGENDGSGRFQEAPYGHLERLKNLTASAPPLTPAALNAPRRAQRAAGRPTSTGAPSVAPAASPPAYPQMMAAFWQTLASEPGVSPLVLEIARKALGG